jgi:hypothetical protein
MGYLYRPKLKDSTPLPPSKDKRCTHAKHGREDTCPACGARFSAVWWIKYYVNGKAVRESTETEKETEAKRFLKTKEGKAATGEPILPRLNRVLYGEAAADIRLHYQTTGERDLAEAAHRLLHLDPFFRTRRLSAIRPADLTRYVAARQAEGAANGTINRELGVLGRMLRLAFENDKLLRLPIIRKLTEAAPAPASSSARNSRP